jgi:ATP-dependent Clp protease ATP-binding subunit ClpA
MLERFTKPARTTVEGATTHAQRATADQVRPEHMLAALLDDEAALAVRVLVDCGVSAGQVRRELDRHRARYVDGLDDDDAEALAAIGIDLDEVVRRVDRHLGGRPSRRPRFSREAKKVLELALREALAMRHNYIGTEHLLLGLARCEDRVVADTLTACGLELPRLRAAVLEALLGAR